MDHPGLIRLHEVLRSPKSIFLVLDLASGGELFNTLAQDGPLPERVARNYFQQLIDALDYMHSRGAIHRDLKPENLLLDANGRLKIADFGLSVFADTNNGLLKTRCGSPNYVAPEIFSTNGYSGPPVDIWSAGVILYVMLAAELPFDAPTIMELARQIMAVRVKYPSNFPPDAVNLLKSILVADPARRYTIEKIRSDKWFAVDYHRVNGTDGATAIRKVTVDETRSDPAAAPADDDDGMDAFSLIAAISAVNMDRLMDQAAPVNASMSFTLTKPKAEIVRLLKQALEGLGVKGPALNPSKDGNSFKPEIPVGNGFVSLRVDVRLVSGNTSLIEFCRLKGKQFDFLRVYRTLKQRLGS
jgi:5'-AMP-activated protein kinase catalytic alpha subunit